MRKDPEVLTWSRELEIPTDVRDDLRLSETIRDSLSLVGWPLPWEMWHDSTGSIFHFALEHPGKRYVVDYDFRGRSGRVQESDKALWRIFNALHGAGVVPGATFMHAWKWYTRLAAMLVIFSVLTGIYLWQKGRREKRTGTWVLIGSLVLSIGWMLQLYLMG